MLPRERYCALVNVLLLEPGRAHADVRAHARRRHRGGLTLSEDGFRAGGLSGEMAQAERTRTLDAFRKGSITTLVCTDVASRGIDVPEVVRVIHAELPESPRASPTAAVAPDAPGRKGLSIMLVPTTAHRYAESLLRGAGIFAELLPAPMAKQVEQAREERLFEELGGEAPPERRHPRVGYPLVRAVWP